MKMMMGKGGVKGSLGSARLKAQAGVSLIEALVGLIVILVAISFYVTSSRSAQKGNERAEVYGKTAAAVREGMEQVYLSSLSDLDAMGGGGRVLSHNQGEGITVRAVSGPVQAADVGGSGALNQLNTTLLRKITLDVDFRGLDGNAVRKRYTTIVYKP